MFEINGNQIRNNGHARAFRYAVGKAVPYGNLLIVLLRIPKGDATVNNICCVDASLNVVWRNERLEERFPAFRPYPFEDMFLENETLMAFDCMGRKYRIAPDTGAIQGYTVSR